MTSVTSGEIQPASRWLRVGDLNFHVLAFGGVGPPLVFLHATGFHAWLWLPYARRLASSHQVYAVDQRGHGQSSKPDTGYRWEVFGTDFAAILEALELEDVRAVGHSKGATAIAAAAVAGTRRLHAAVLIEPVLFSGPTTDAPVWESPLAVGARRRRHTWQSREAMYAHLRHRPPFSTWTDAFVRLYVDHGVDAGPDGQIELRCPGHIEAEVYACAPMSDSLAFLEQLTVPSLLMRGEHSPGLGGSQAAEALRRLPAGSLCTVPNAGHFVPMERPDEVAAAIEAFFRAHP